MQIEVYGYTAQGNRQENEDTGAFEQFGKDQLYAIVADGLGGHGGGKAASAAVVEAMVQCKSEKSLPDEKKITRWLQQANQEILRKRNGPQHMKSTVTALYVAENQAIWVHVGDSRLYHFYNGELANYTVDHSVSQIAVKLGEIHRNDLPNHPDRSKLLKVVGGTEVSPEFRGPLELKPGSHAFLLCSDGLWERLHEEEILLDLHKSETPEQWIGFLRCRAERRKSTDVDNNTAMAVFLKE